MLDALAFHLARSPQGGPMRNRSRESALTPWAAALLVVAGASAATLSFALPFSVTIYDTKQQPWTMFTDDPRVQVLEDTTPRTGPNDTSRTLTVRKVVFFDSMVPVKISFTQNAFATESYGGAANNETARSGLNFDMENIIFNNTTILWNGFAETVTDRDRRKDGDVISDVTIPATFGAGNHPTRSHFHPVDGGGTNPPSLGPDSWEALNMFDGENRILYGTPPGSDPDTLDPGGEFNFKLKIHDIVVINHQRRFDLLEIPVPEPSTLALLGLGLLGIGFGRRRISGFVAGVYRRRRVRQVAVTAADATGTDQLAAGVAQRPLDDERFQTPRAG